MIKLTLPFLLAASSLAFAHSSHDHNHNHDHNHDHDHSHDQHALDSHVHGMANLDVVLEGSMLLVSLKAPAADLVGFEHQASTDEQRSQVYDMLGKMELPEILWSLPVAAECVRQDVQVEHDLLEEAHDHEHDHDHHYHAHSDVLVDYHYECAHPEHLDTVRVNLFDAFPSLHDIQVQLITEGGQKGQTLNAAQNLIRMN